MCSDLVGYIDGNVWEEPAPSIWRVGESAGSTFLCCVGTHVQYCTTSCLEHSTFHTGSSKKMDGIWNRYNLKSTRWIDRPADFCFSTVPVSLNWFIHWFKALSVGGFSPGCKLCHLRCTASTDFSSAYHNTNWAFWWTVHIMPHTD